MPEEQVSRVTENITKMGGLDISRYGNGGMSLLCSVKLKIRPSNPIVLFSFKEVKIEEIEVEAEEVSKLQGFAAKNYQEL